jgi:hypothetical protein
VSHAVRLIRIGAGDQQSELVKRTIHELLFLRIFSAELLCRIAAAYVMAWVTGRNEPLCSDDQILG